MPIVRLNNGNIDAEGTLNALSVTAGSVSTETINGDITAEDLHVTSGITALTVDCNTLDVEQTVITSGMQALTATIGETLTVGGDLIIEGDDDRVLGDIITDIPADQASLSMRHNYWYRTGDISAINILADADSGRIKTCYIISAPANPLVLNGVNWLWEPVELEDTNMTHVIALQQIGAGPVMANIAYSY